MRTSRGGSVRVGVFTTLVFGLLASTLSGASRARKPATSAAADKLREEAVQLTVTVTDTQNRPVVNLKHDAFTVFDDKQPQKITSFTEADQPASVGILLDTSGSMRDAKMVNILRDNLPHFIEQSHRTNEYFLIGFNDSVQLLTDWTSDRKALAEGLNQITQIKGASALFDALYAGIEKIKQGKHAKHVLLLISDGQDNGSDHKFGETHRRLKESDVMVYTLGIGNKLTDPLAQYGPNLLAEFASLSGGVVYFPSDLKEAIAALSRIAMELRHQYVIEFYPTNTRRDGKWHKVKIEAKPVAGKDDARPDAPPKSINLKTRTRAGYYAGHY